MDCQARAQSVTASVSDSHASDAIQLAAPLASDVLACESRVTGDSHPSAANSEDSDAIQLAVPMVCEVSDSEPEVIEVSAITLAATSASQPSASSSFAHMLASPSKKAKIERMLSELNHQSPVLVQYYDQRPYLPKTHQKNLETKKMHR